MGIPARMNTADTFEHVFCNYTYLPIKYVNICTWGLLSIINCWLEHSNSNINEIYLLMTEFGIPSGPELCLRLIPFMSSDTRPGVMKRGSKQASDRTAWLNINFGASLTESSSKTPPSAGLNVLSSTLPSTWSTSAPLNLPEEFTRCAGTYTVQLTHVLLPLHFVPLPFDLHRETAGQYLTFAVRRPREKRDHVLNELFWTLYLLTLLEYL